MTVISRGSLITADAIVLSVTWYKLGARKTSAVTSSSFSHILLRDGEIEYMNPCQSIKMPIQEQYISGTSEWELSHSALTASETSWKHIVLS